MRTYSELKKLSTFEERFKYLSVKSEIGLETFGHERHLNQVFYSSPQWREVREHVALRDDFCDLAIPDNLILGRIHIHHMNPIEPRDVYDFNEDILNPEYLISVSLATHNAIHYGANPPPRPTFAERLPGDTILW